MTAATVCSRFLRAMAFSAIAVAGCQSAFATEASTVDALLSESGKQLYSNPAKALAPLEALRALQPGFTPAQNERYHLILANSLGFRAQHAERVALVQSFIDQVKTPGRRASFLYELIDGYTALGQYEQALHAMNESIALLPVLTTVGDKITVLQAAIATAIVFDDYPVALDFAERIYALRSDNKQAAYAACVGLTDKVELHFMQGDSAQARALLQEAIDTCKANKNQFFVLINQTNAAVDRINGGQAMAGIASAQPLFAEHETLSQSSDYVAQLEEAVARAYLQLGNTERAQHFGLRAYQHAQTSNVLTTQAKASKTMAAVKRAQGMLDSALVYYDAHVAIRKRQQEDQLQKNLAYQRVRFDVQDRANQLALLEQANKTLNIEKALHKRRNQNLILLMVLSVLVFAVLGLWLRVTLKIKNVLRKSSQVDRLTQISSRGHFIAVSQKVFLERGHTPSLLLFDMDLFKSINDTYGHATGDWVLTTVCETVKLHLPKRSHFGRLGGEEFAICLPQLGAQDAKALAEICRDAIANIGPHPSGLNLEITASFGLATRSVHGPVNFEEALAAADKALYVSKNAGRNRVTAYHPPDPLPT